MFIKSVTEQGTSENHPSSHMHKHTRHMAYLAKVKHEERGN